MDRHLVLIWKPVDGVGMDVQLRLHQAGLLVGDIPAGVTGEFAWARVSSFRASNHISQLHDTTDGHYRIVSSSGKVRQDDFVTPVEVP